MREYHPRTEITLDYSEIFARIKTLQGGFNASKSQLERLGLMKAIHSELSSCTEELERWSKTIERHAVNEVRDKAFGVK